MAQTGAVQLLERRLLMSRLASIRAGDVDSSFGSGGRIVVDFGAGSESAEALAVQPDGKVVVAGSADGSLAVARYNADGSPDVVFGSGGSVRTGAATSSGGSRAMAIGADGGIVVAGTAVATGGAAPGGASLAVVVVRYRPDGTPDGSFGVNGTAIIDVSSWNDLPTDVLVQPDGKVLVAGYSTALELTKPQGGYFLLRLGADGSRDEGFGGGLVFGAVPHMTISRPEGLALQGDGRIILGVYASGDEPDPYTNFATVVRYDANGALDGSFAAAPVPRVTPVGVAVGADGRVLLAGTGVDADDGDFDLSMRRYQPNGGADEQFGAGGGSLTNFARGRSASGSGRVVNSDDTARASAVAPDGSIVVLSDVILGRDGEQIGLARFAPDGSLDRAFGDGGKVLGRFGTSPSPVDVAVGPDGDVLVMARVGVTDWAYQVARYHGRSVRRFATLSNGTLRVRGTDGADRITLGNSLGTSGVTFLDVTVNDVTEQFDSSAVHRILVRAGRGNDVIDGWSGFISPSGDSRFPVTLDGGPGNDEIKGSQYRDRLLGGWGDDTIIALDSNGGLYGDVVFGGPGQDQATVNPRRGPGEPGDVMRSIEEILLS